MKSDLIRALRCAETYKKDSIGRYIAEDEKFGWYGARKFIKMNDLANELCVNRCAGYKGFNDENPCSALNCPVFALYTSYKYYFDKYRILRKGVEKEIEDENGSGF